jgi:hypothetical protein
MGVDFRSIGYRPFTLLFRGEVRLGTLHRDFVWHNHHNHGQPMACCGQCLWAGNGPMATGCRTTNRFGASVGIYAIASRSNRVNLLSTVRFSSRISWTAIPEIKHRAQGAMFYFEFPSINVRRRWLLIPISIAQLRHHHRRTACAYCPDRTGHFRFRQNRCPCRA